jgi:hypothetical protein
MWTAFRPEDSVARSISKLNMPAYVPPPLNKNYLESGRARNKLGKVIKFRTTAGPHLWPLNRLTTLQASMSITRTTRSTHATAARSEPACNAKCVATEPSGSSADSVCLLKFQVRTTPSLPTDARRLLVLSAPRPTTLQS